MNLKLELVSKLSEKISSIPRVDSGSLPREGVGDVAFQRRPEWESPAGWKGMKGKAVASGQEMALGCQGTWVQFSDSWISWTWDVICSEEIKTEMQSKWPTVTHKNPEVQIIPPRAFYSTWLSAPMVWHAASVILLGGLVSGLCIRTEAGKSCALVGFDVTTALRCGLFCLCRISPLRDSCWKLWYFDFEGLLHSTILRNKGLIFHKNNIENVWEKFKGDP